MRDDDLIFASLPKYDDKFVYQSCGQWIVVMQLPTELANNTNEDRPNVLNQKYAKFRVRVIKTIDIIHAFTINKKIDQIAYNAFNYEIGQTTFNPHYNPETSKIYGQNEIYYFHSIAPCFYNRQRAWLPAQNGRLIGWHEDTGKKHFEAHWLDQKIIFTKQFNKEDIDI